MMYDVKAFLLYRCHDYCCMCVCVRARARVCVRACARARVCANMFSWFYFYVMGYVLQWKNGTSKTTSLLLGSDCKDIHSLHTTARNFVFSLDNDLGVAVQSLAYHLLSADFRCTSNISAVSRTL